VGGTVCPHPHFLASWADAEAVNGVVNLAQPTIQPLGDVRPLLESLAIWSGNPRSAYAILQQYWRQNIYPRKQRECTFQTFWDGAVHDGFVRVIPRSAQVETFNLAAVRPILRARQPADGAHALVLYPKVGMRDGRHAYNPWLHELPDPISKVAWDNYVCLSPATATELEVQ